jgi:hypothetical protein
MNFPFGFCYDVCVAMSGQLSVHKTEKLNLAPEILMELPILLTPGGVKTYSLSSMLEMSLIEC